MTMIMIYDTCLEMQRYPPFAHEGCNSEDMGDICPRERGIELRAHTSLYRAPIFSVLYLNSMVSSKLYDLGHQTQRCFGNQTSSCLRHARVLLCYVGFALVCQNNALYEAFAVSQSSPAIFRLYICSHLVSVALFNLFLLFPSLCLQRGPYDSLTAKALSTLSALLASSEPNGPKSRPVHSQETLAASVLDKSHQAKATPRSCFVIVGFRSFSSNDRRSPAQAHP